MRELVGCDVMSAKDNKNLASDLAALGYPGFSHLKPSPRRAPAEVVLFALQVANLEPRLVEALPGFCQRVAI